METPYLHIVGMPREMEGKGAPDPTVFGVLGHTKPDSETKTLGGLVSKAPTERIQKGTVMKKVPDDTERKIGGKPSKTHIPGAHYAMVPYPGHFMSAVGKKL